ncbi:putative AC transposase [Dictyocoela muelleri]|nr:putative AC transposase [Dictyocoela muelleri]
MVVIDGICFNTFCKSRDLRRLLGNNGFKNILKSPNTVRQIVLNYGEKIKILIKTEFSNLTNRPFSVTLDEWTSIRNRRYMNVNIHCINKFLSLGLLRIHGVMSAERILYCLNKKLVEFNISMGDIFSMTTDGASSMKKACKLSGIFHQLCLAIGASVGCNRSFI